MNAQNNESGLPLTARSQTRPGSLTAILLAAMLALRYMITIARIFFPDHGLLVAPIYETGTYLLVAICMVWNEQSLADYHIPPLAIGMLVLFKPLETIYLATNGQLYSPLAFPGLPSLIIWAIALFLLIYFRRRLFGRGILVRQEWKWLGWGMIAGLIGVIILAVPLSLQVVYTVQHTIPWMPGLISSVGWIPYQIGYAAASEEPVFRGFLWGYLHKSGWREGWIWCFQAILFTLAHAYYFPSLPISFFLVVPFGGLLLGWLAWRSRSISTSMIAHGVMNGLGATVGTFVAAIWQ